MEINLVQALRELLNDVNRKINNCLGRADCSKLLQYVH